MKVLHMIYALHGGGAEKQCVSLCKHSEEAIVAHIVGSNPLIKAYKVNRENRLGISLIKQYNALIRNTQPDIVHLWLPHLVNCMGLISAKINMKPVVGSYRNVMKIRNFKDIVELPIYFFVDGIISNTPINAHGLVYKIAYKLRKGVYIRNGYDLSEYNQRSEYIGQVKKFVFIGRLTDQKNIKLLLDEFILALCLNPNISLDIYGEGELKHYVLERISNYNQITYHGYSSNINKEIIQYDCLLLPSKYEGMPNVIIEAMISKVVTISSNIQSNLEIINNNINGYLFDLDKENSLSSIIQNVSNLKNTELNSIAENAYEFARKQSIEVTNQSIQDYYNGIIRKKNNL